MQTQDDTIFGFNKEAFKKYFFNTGWLFAEKILRMVLGLGVGVWVARYLGPAKFGLLSYAQSFVALFAAISTLGVDQIVVRELVKYPEKEKELLGTAFVLRVFGAIVTLGVLMLSVNFTTNDAYTNALIFIMGSATVFQAFKVIELYFQAKVMSKYAVIANIISVSISSIVKIILILYKAPLIDFAWVVLFDSFVLAAGYLYFFEKKSSFNFFKLQAKITSAISILKVSWPLILSGIAITIYMRIDQVMIKDMLDNKAVGNYAAAVKLSEVWYFIPMVITSSLFPAVINAKKIDSKVYYERLQKLYDMMVWMAIAIALPTTFISDRVINLLYGANYSEAGSVLKIYIWAGLFTFLGVASSQYLISENFTKISFYRTLIGSIVNVTLNFFLIPEFGINGAAFATLLSYFTATFFIFFPQKTRKQAVMMINSIFFVSILKRTKYVVKDY